VAVGCPKVAAIIPPGQTFLSCIGWDGHESALTMTEVSMARLRDKQKVLAVMRRLGMADKVEEADALLPDVVDLDRDRELFLSLGIDTNVDTLMNRLSSSP
jgi:hypothetical protein